MGHWEEGEMEEFTCSFSWVSISSLDFPGGSDGQESACNAGDLGLIPGLGRSPGEGNGNLLQYSCLVNPMDRGASWAIVHGVTKDTDTTQQLNNKNNILLGSCETVPESLALNSEYPPQGNQGNMREQVESFLY